jgi:TonB family protein
MNLKLFSLKSVALFVLTSMFGMANIFAQENPSPSEVKEEKVGFKIEVTNTADPSKNLVQSSKISVNEQTKTSEVEIKDGTSVFFMPHQKPMYMDGTQALYYFPTKEARYPAELQKEKPQGIVMVRFIVETDGSISNPEVIASVHPKLDAEALRVVSKLKNFYPGKNIEGENVRCYVDFPVPFLLDKK